MTIMEAKGICKTYNPNTPLEVKALKPLDLAIEQGKFHAIIGRSGSGKSTLLQILGGLDAPTGGKLFLEGKSVFDLKDTALCKLRRRRIGFVFQAYNLLSEHTVLENILIPLHVDGRDADPAYLNEVLEALEAGGILGGLPVEGGILWCATEKISKAELDRAAAIVKEVLSK